MESGALRKLNEAYFKRIEAIEYSVKYDDGKHFSDIGEADALIVGVSRTSKTPLSMYLANKGYKIANIPLVPEVSIPDSVLSKRVTSIWINCKSTVYCKYTKSRAETLGLSKASQYNNLNRIKEELSYAEEVFKN